MKNLILTFFFIAGFISVTSAQFGIGAGVVYGTDSELGFTGRVNYNINSKIGIFAGYSLLSSESEDSQLGEISATLSAIDIDGHYTFSEGATKPYVLAGISLLMAKVELLGESESGNETGINVGAGILHGLSDNFSIFAEGKYVIVDEGQAVFTAGAHYAF